MNAAIKSKDDDMSFLVQEPEPLDTDADASPEPGGLVARVHAQLHDMVLKHEIPLGTPISERQLSLQLGVSRTPLREALRRLEGEGFIRRSRGVLEVRRISLEEFLDLLKIRKVLEAEAAGLAAGAIDAATIDDLRQRLTGLAEAERPDNHERVSLDLELHRTICAACGNESMARLIEELRRKSMLFAAPPPPQDFRASVAQHLALLDALAAGDSAGARQAMADHLDKTLANVLSRLLKR
ncbi:MAG: GntR family transcriptional regulator [Pigmentiphaga sp.]|uniref:GntR family transcriptional regulator n=1 Tax=Pigmentiphaga sp. TaxID=1977564 RepID=UPI0029BD4634|nr:GntR family transcriptional regulator [Pigmentiphaga sp.]MDX3904709.1 GntR family transcriptional regulator [Pigmentiphaga sp.]